MTINAVRALYVCRQGGNHEGSLLRALAEAEGVRPHRMMEAAWARRRWAGAPSARPAAKARPLPSPAQVDGWASRLWSSGEPLAWLLKTRGLSEDVVRGARIGWNGEHLTFPMYHRDELVAIKTREPRAGAQMWNWPGKDRPWPLYPEPRSRDQWLLLVEGELDALRGRSARLPAVSITLGKGTWRDSWADDLRGRAVAVCFDNDAQAAARERVRQLRAAGARAVRLDLWRLGLRTPKGDLSDYLNGGGSRAALVRHLSRTSSGNRDAEDRGDGGV